jgi:hypothetical protein
LFDQKTGKLQIRTASVFDKIGAANSIIIDPIGERWVKGERLVRTDSGWERVPEPER